MKAILSFLILALSIDDAAARRKSEEEYLSKATDLVDLERRQRKLMRVMP